MTDLLLTGIGLLTTNDGDPIRDAVVAAAAGRITYVGDSANAPDQGSASRVDCGGRAVLPGFVDAHTHLVFAGDRSNEFALKMSGADYRQIAASGGGILSTVEATRAASHESLFAEAAERVQRMVQSGTTTIEIKSGYGLDLETEIRLLEVMGRIAGELPVTIRSTFLGAHSIPAEFRHDRDRYIEILIDEMIPRVAPLATYCDAFVEEGAFSVDEARAILSAAAGHGMKARVHAEQLTHSGGAALAAELGAVSADHLDHATSEDAAVLAEAGVAAVLVPGASYMMRSAQAPGPMLWEAGCKVALATDCNPGTSFFEGMGPIISLAVVEMGLTTEQAIWAATRGGALALEMDDRGMVAPGAVADLVILDAPSPTHIPYRPATNLVWRRIKDGRPPTG